MARLDYRPDVDGLRALAIVPVVWFHSGLPGLPGGFVGVDIFFVISGFLIAGIVNREIAERQFSLLRFYERRVRRIGPALTLVLLATLLVGYALLLPYELVALAHSAIAALAMVPNVYFWRQAGYFALGEGVTPLLHTWSLGVEEQFYIFFPLFLAILHRLKLVRSGLVAVALLSLALCVYGTAKAPSFAFYMLPTRAWELTIGALIAVWGGRYGGAWLSWTGLALIGGSLVAIDADSSFPGWIAMLPVVGAGLVIAAGPAAPGNRLLSHPILVAIGKISYSLYLWHWPCFVFLRHFQADPKLGLGYSVLGIAASFGLATATYWLVEQPARRKSMPFKRVGLGVVTGAVTIAIAALLAVRGDGWPQRLSPSVQQFVRIRDDLPLKAHQCVNTSLDRIRADCTIGQGQPNVLVWGDSHAAAVAQGVQSGFERPVLIAAMNSCVPSLSWQNPVLKGRDPVDCANRNAQLLELAMRDPNLDTVVFAAYWPSHFRSGGGVMWNSVAELARQLRGKGKRVIVLAGTPEPGADLPWASAIRARFNRAPLTWPCPPSIFPTVDVEVIDLSAAYCRHGQPLRLFTDANHPSGFANREVIAPTVAAWLRKSAR